jgi:hypothetical protein
VTNVDASNNGGAGFRIESDATGKGNATCTAANPAQVGDNCALGRAGDIDQIAIKDSTFNHNGDRAAVGSGNGISIRTAVDGSIRNVTIDPTEASSNNDHGAFVSASRNVSNVLVENSTFNNNDRNRDTVGDGVQVTANEDLSQIAVKGVTANSNYGGIRVGAAGRQIAQNVLVENCTANDNVKEGVSLFAGRDLISGAVKNSKFSGNGIGIYVEAVQRGTDLSVTDNKIVGRNGTGVGIQLKATNTTISKNDIRTNETGILVHKAAGSKANNNNIARNEKFGVDASALAPGEEFDATNNWWGEPSGPKAADNPGGIGDRVSQKVKYRPFARRARRPDRDRLRRRVPDGEQDRRHRRRERDLQLHHQEQRHGRGHAGSDGRDQGRPGQCREPVQPPDHGQSCGLSAGELQLHLPDAGHLHGDGHGAALRQHQVRHGERRRDCGVPAVRPG